MFFHNDSARKGTNGATSFVVVTIASMLGGGGRVSPLWLVLVYLLLTRTYTGTAIRAARADLTALIRGALFSSRERGAPHAAEDHRSTPPLQMG